MRREEIDMDYLPSDSAIDYDWSLDDMDGQDFAELSMGPDGPCDLSELFRSFSFHRVNGDEEMEGL